jgi:hypothetical protein
MKLTCMQSRLVVLLAGSVQTVRTRSNGSQPVFWLDLVGCVPVTDIHWVAAMAGR